MHVAQACPQRLGTGADYAINTLVTPNQGKYVIDDPPTLAMISMPMCHE